MNLDELKPNLAAGDFSNKLASACGVKVDINSLDLDHTQKMLFRVNEQIERKRLSEGRHSNHKSRAFASYMLLKRGLETHLTALRENEENPSAEKECPACGGSGAHDGDADIKDCPKCDGEGYYFESKRRKGSRRLNEGEGDKAELLLATKDIVDRVQKTVDDIGKIRNEDLPPLLDKIREEIGSEIADSYGNVAGPSLDALVESARDARDVMSKASRILSGEDAGGMGADVGMDDEDDFADEAGMEAFPDDEMEIGGGEEMGMDDEFGASDAATGGENIDGRDER